MELEEKKSIVKNIEKKIDKSNYIYFTNFKHLKAADMSKLRSSLKKVDSEMSVYKNRLIQRALKKKSLEELSTFIDGQTALIFGYDDPVPSIKIIAEFISENGTPVLNGSYLDGKVIDTEGTMKLATIPSREELLTKMVEILSSPLNKMVYILSGITGRLINVLSEIAKQKEE